MLHSKSGTSSLRAAGWPSAGIRTSRRRAASTSISATSRRSTRPPTSSSSSPRPPAAGGSAATRSRCPPPPRAGPARRRAAAPTRRSSAPARPPPTVQKHDPFGSRVPDHSVVHRYARCVSYPEWGVGTVSGIYFSGDGDDVQQWARVSFSVGVRTIPAGSLQFVDFSKPDPAADRVRAVHDRRPARARRGRSGARRPATRLRAGRRAVEPVGAAAAHRRVLAGRQPAGGGARGPRLGARRDRPADPRALRLPDLRGHGRVRPRGRGGRAGGRPRPR